MDDVSDDPGSIEGGSRFTPVIQESGGGTNSLVPEKSFEGAIARRNRLERERKATQEEEQRRQELRRQLAYAMRAKQLAADRPSPQTPVLEAQFPRPQHALQRESQPQVSLAKRLKDKMSSFIPTRKEQTPEFSVGD